MHTDKDLFCFLIMNTHKGTQTRQFVSRLADVGSFWKEKKRCCLPPPPILPACLCESPVPPLLSSAISPVKAVPGDAKALDNGQQRQREQADDEPVPRHIELLEEVEGAKLAGPAPPSWSVANLLLLPTSTPMHDDADQPIADSRRQTATQSIHYCRCTTRRRSGDLPTWRPR